MVDYVFRWTSDYRSLPEWLYKGGCSGGCRCEPASTSCTGNKSFVRQRVGQRFSQHPLLLEFAREKAQGRPREFAGTEDRHSRYFLTMLSTLEEALVGSGQLGALELLDAELANLRRAWSWVVAQADGNLLGKAAKPLGDYLQYARQISRRTRAVW